MVGGSTRKRKKEGSRLFVERFHWEWSHKHPTDQTKSNCIPEKKGLYNDEQKNEVDDTKHNIHQAMILSAK
jgi:hypothetical protein